MADLHAQLAARSPSQGPPVCALPHHRVCLLPDLRLCRNPHNPPQIRRAANCRPARTSSVPPGWAFDPEAGKGGVPYGYDREDFKQIGGIGGDPLDGGGSLPPSQKEMKALLEKYGCPTSTLFIDVDGYPEERPGGEEYGRWLGGGEEEGGGEGGEEEGSELSFEQAESLVNMVEGGFEARQEWEMQQVWNKAMELHHSQRERARNIYAMVHWYSSILAKIEKQEYYEGVTPCPVPPFVRGMFALEEEFEKLNEEQKEVDVLASKYSEILDQVDFYNFVEENLEFSPTELEGRGAGWGNGVLEALRGETHADEEESDVEEDDEEYDEQKVALGEAKDKGKKALGYELDELLSGIIPNAGSDEEAAEETMSYMKDLLDEGDLTPATVEEPL